MAVVRSFLRTIDEDIATVHAGGREGDLADNDALGTLDMEEAVLVLLGGDMLEASLDATLVEVDLLEVGEEESRLEALDLTVLNKNKKKN